MTHNGTEELPEKGFQWTAEKEEAALLLAEDELSDQEIADKLDIGRRTIYRWRDHPEFTARIADHVKRIGKRALSYAVAKHARRVQDLDEKWRKLNRAIEARGASEEMKNVPGGETGLVIRRKKAIGSGDNTQFVEEYEIDTATLKENREILKQAAQEVGQWQDKTDLTTGGQPFKCFIGVDVDKV